MFYDVEFHRYTPIDSISFHLKPVFLFHSISTLTDWKCEDLSGKDLFSFCHPGDVASLKKAHTDCKWNKMHKYITIKVVEYVDP